MSTYKVMLNTAANALLYLANKGKTPEQVTQADTYSAVIEGLRKSYEEGEIEEHALHNVLRQISIDATIEMEDLRKTIISINNFVEELSAKTEKAS